MTYAEQLDAPASLSFLQIVNELMIEHALQFPGTVQDAMCLYAELVVLIEAQV